MSERHSARHLICNDGEHKQKAANRGKRAKMMSIKALRRVTQGRSTVRVGVIAKSFLVTRMVNCALHASQAQARSFGSVATTRIRVDRHKGHAIVNEFIRHRSHGGLVCHERINGRGRTVAGFTRRRYWADPPVEA
jgi:hypothetical protein